MNPFLSMHGIVVDLAWLQATTSGYCQLGLVVYAAEDGPEVAAVDVIARTGKTEPPLRLLFNLLSHMQRSQSLSLI